MRNWDIWLAVLLLTVGGTCLLVSTSMPFGTIGPFWHRLIHIAEIILLIFIGGCLLWVYLKGLKKKRASKCASCRYPLDSEWLYCPQCGAKKQAGD